MVKQRNKERRKVIKKVVEERENPKAKVTFNESIIKKLPRTGNEYYDKFTRGREKIACRIVRIPFDKLQSVAYTTQVIKDIKPAKGKKLELPIIDTYAKQTAGLEYAVAGKKAGLTKIPVLVFAKVDAHIDWWKVRKGIK